MGLKAVPFILFKKNYFSENETIANFTNSVVKAELNGTKLNVINGKNANLFLVLARNKYSQVRSLLVAQL